MKKVLVVTFLVVFSMLGNAQDTVAIEAKVKEKVIEWANQTFKKYDNPRFEKFLIYYSDAYQMWMMRPSMLDKKLKQLEKSYADGTSNLSEEAYQEQKKSIIKQKTDVKERLDKMTNFAEKFTIHFWANIQTNDGITVQYEHIMVLDGAYNVIENKINSAIGKKSSATKILYK